MIQILGMRERTDDKGKTKTVMALLSRKWRVSSVANMFLNIETVLDNIPEAEHYNLFYTIAVCQEGPGRKLKHQDVIPIDIDDIDTSRAEEYFQLACKVWWVDPEKTGCIMSGHGIQMVIQTESSFSDPKFFDEHREEYKAYCTRLNAEMALKNLPGKADASVWGETRMLRVPETLNQKPDKPPVKAQLLHRNISPQEFKWQEAPKIPPNQVPEDIKRFPRPDDAAVIKGCEFLKSMANTTQKIEEPLWYGALSIIGRLNNKELPHTIFSKNSENWDRERTEKKVEQALIRSGPLTCAKINQLWGKCERCPHWGTGLPSPILIKNPKHIATEDMGFRQLIVDRNGAAKPGPVVYDDLLLAFERDHLHVTTEDTEEVYTWNGKFWEIMTPAQIRAYAQDKIAKPVVHTHAQEFLNLLKRTNVKPRSFFNEDTANRLNLNNGVYNTNSGELEPHSPMYGFRYALEYDYDAKAKAPLFKRFLGEITRGDQSLMEILLEFMGFTISNHDCDPPYALFLVGDGSNGKSTFIEIMRAVVGRANCAGITLKDLQNECMRDMLDGKLANFSEETPKFSMIDNSIFKTLTDGGDVPARKLYHPAYMLKNRAKFIFACNELPRSYDPTMGMFRRLLVVPFNATFEGQNIDRRLKHKVIDAELPGILNMCLVAYKRFLKHLNFSKSVTVEQAVDDYRGQIDTARVWVHENLFEFVNPVWEFPVSPENAVANKVGFKTFTDIYEAYCLDMEKIRERPMEFKQFSKRIHAELKNQTNRIRRISTGSRKETAILGIPAGRTMH